MTNISFTATHDPSDQTDYIVRFDNLLSPGEVVSAIQLDIDSASSTLGIALGADDRAPSFTGTSVKFWLACAEPGLAVFTEGHLAVVDIKITTSAVPSRTFERSAVILVKQSSTVPQSPKSVTILTQLSEARSVYHDWRLGKVARSFRDSNGEEVTYSVEGMRNLAAYIADLERQSAGAAGAPPPNRPLRVWF